MICSFAGTIGKDAEVVNTQNGQILKFSVAESNYNFKTKQKVTKWRNCQMFGKNLDGVATILKKGNNISVSGATEETEEYNDKVYTNYTVQNSDKAFTVFFKEPKESVASSDDVPF